MTSFEQACVEVGVTPKYVPQDGRWHRTDTNSKNGKKDGAILFFPDGRGGIVKNWQTGEQNVFWLHSNSNRFHKNKINFKKTFKYENKKIVEQKRAAKEAVNIYSNLPAANPGHKYLMNKKVMAHKGLKQDEKSNLVIPVFVSSDISSLQYISPEGKKRFLRDGRTSGGYFLVGTIDELNPICIAEGYATAASIYESTNYPCVNAFSAYNLIKVSKFIRKVFPTKKIVICGDTGSVGIKEAIESALAVGGKVAFPNKLEVNYGTY